VPSGTLPSDGAWTQQFPYAVPAGARRLGFLVQYTGATDGAQLAFRVRKGFLPVGASEAVMASELVVDDASAVSGTTVLQIAADHELLRPVSDTAATAFTVDVDITGGWNYVVLELAERGQPLKPGLAQVDVVGSY